MFFLTIRQVTLTGERKTLIHLSALAYIQGILSDHDFGWQIGLEPTRALIFLHHKLEPILALDRPEDLVKQVAVNGKDANETGSKPSKQPR